MKEIPINIWDDYADDGHGFQETDIRVEWDHMSDNTERQVLTFLMRHITENIPLEGVTFELYWRDPKVIHPNWADTGSPEFFWSPSWRLKVTNLTHIQREYLLEKLQSNKLLHFEGNKFNFYSES